MAANNFKIRKFMWFAPIILLVLLAIVLFSLARVLEGMIVPGHSLSSAVRASAQELDMSIKSKLDERRFPNELNCLPSSGLEPDRTVHPSIGGDPCVIVRAAHSLGDAPLQCTRMQLESGDCLGMLMLQSDWDNPIVRRDVFSYSQGACFYGGKSSDSALFTRITDPNCGPPPPGFHKEGFVRRSPCILLLDRDAAGFHKSGFVMLEGGRQLTRPSDWCVTFSEQRLQKLM